MLGKRVPLPLKIFLTTLAVVDDIGGIVVGSLIARISGFVILHFTLPRGEAPDAVPDE